MEIYVKIKDVNGMAQNKAWKDYHKVEGLSWGASNTSASGGDTFTGGGKASVQDISFSKTMDGTSPQLMQKCVLGEHIADVEINFVTGAQQTQKYMTITLKDVLISSFAFGGGGTAESVPVETISLGFGSFEIAVFKLDSKTSKLEAGSKFGYDLKAAATA